jgi:uncharacterized membrane protein YjgN (DUF898 family)
MAPLMQTQKTEPDARRRRRLGLRHETLIARSFHGFQAAFSLATDDLSRENGSLWRSMALKLAWRPAMHIPTVERRLSEARPWGLAPGEQEGIRLEPQQLPLAGTVIKGMLLTLVTLGLYRFWFKSRLRRYYWSNTRLLGDGFEYTGTGRELFIGFLIAIAILAPLYLAATISTLMAGMEVGKIVSTLVGFVVMPALLQIAMYRARRYRLSRTRYRGIRFSQSGTGTGYLLHSIKWMLLVIVTLGICMPMLRTALYRYRMGNTFFGQVQARFEGDAKPLMKRWLVVWGAIVAAFVVIGLISVSEVMNAGVFVVAVELLVLLALIASVPVLWISYRAAEFRHFTSGTSFGAMRLASDVRTRSVIWAMVKFGLLLLLAVIGLGLLLGVLGYFLIGDRSGAEGAAGIVYVLAFPFMLTLFLTYGLLTELYLRRRLWALYASSVSIANTKALADILQREQQHEGGVGEAFDGGFEIAG